VNALAPAATDSNNAGFTVRLFDDTTEEGVGFDLLIPSGAANVVVRLISRAETAPGATQTVQPALYTRRLPDNAAVTAWSAAVLMATISIPTNENWQYDSETFTLAALSLVAGQVAQFELTRKGTAGGDTLTGDWTLFAVIIEIT
jgi:hypothetical protein